MNFNLRAMFKKPASVKEAKEKKDTAKLAALGCLGSAIVLAVLGGLTNIGFIESLGMILIVLAVVCFYFWYCAKSEVARFQTIYCECGEKYTYPDHVTYKEIGEQISSGKDPNNDNIIRHTSTKVTLFCTCRKCGKERTVDTTFVTQKDTFNKRGVLLTTKTYPIENLLKNFFEQ